ncbi:NAD(P)-dependent oxidoreductase [Coraliomargarita sp. SDUM461004]|uniref:NAD(P)-dependent oxidoreductase n=1 Tax=Thalassobacterium sedimentorum TaxID=3041258 RepID=A0ABU1AIC7_9BACT|nr:NAD(P)-dependent oxidoreductase [Coraliomargarita sp. SDUM461004]MDQ8193536.1 NAD(P)-dependent oxidoreductase [Coraliomargarita sp. SDUM461004]
MQETKVAVIGLGIIGSIWAANYASEDMLAASWNRTPKPDLDLKQTDLAGCAKAAQHLQICLYDADSVREVLKQLLPHLNAGHVVIQSSTIDGESATEFSKLVHNTGARYLEAPFTGSKPAAEQRQTVFFLGGSPALVTEIEPLLAKLSSKRFHIGTPHQATAVKLAMNLQIASISQALCEAITLTRSADISDDCFFEVLRANVSWSGLAELKESKLRQADYSPQFSTKNLHKDMRLAKQTAKCELPQLERTLQTLATAEAAGYSEQDFISMIQLLEE